MSRTTLTITDDVFDRLEDRKQDDESWSDVLDRAADALESDDGGVNADPNTVAVENVDEVARATADEVESRMTRR